MSNVFRVERCGYKNLVQKITTRSEMLGVFGPRNLKNSIRTDYVLDIHRFECVVGGEKQWVEYNQIFDADIHCIGDFINRVALDGDFDKSLPMSDQEELKCTDDFSDSYFWTFMPPQSDYSKYWNVVGSCIKRNILSHTRPGCKLDVRCIRIKTNTQDWFDWFQKSQAFRIELYINEINKEKCYWVNTTKIYASPIIIFDLILAKN